MFGPFFHTILIEQVFGLYLLIMAIIFLSRAPYYRDLGRNIKVSGSVFLASSIELMLGLFLVVIHNFWVWEPRLVVTVICWVVLVRAIIWLAFPEAMVARTQKLADGPWYYLVSFAMAALGVYLVIAGFYPHMHL